MIKTKEVISLLVICFFSSCASSQVEEEPIQKHYFYFDRTHPKMEVYGNKRELRHLYDINNPYNHESVIFIPYDSIEKEIKIKKIKKYKVKDYNWLNSLTGLESDKFFIKQIPKKSFI